jgi:acetyl-CoA carboxylase biotin carboxyl carrier protein
VSKQKSRKTRKRRPPIILPQAFAAAPSGLGTPLLSGQQTKHIQELIDLLKKNNLTELELEREGLRVRVRYETGVKAITATVADQGTPGSTSAAQPTGAAGDYVKKGQVLCIVEAMKLMNEIESEVDGRVTKILAESTKPVEYGQALFLVDPTATP